MRRRAETVQTTIRLPAELREELQREADRRGESLNGFVIQCLHMALNINRK